MRTDQLPRAEHQATIPVGEVLLANVAESGHEGDGDKLALERAGAELDVLQQHASELGETPDGVVGDYVAAAAAEHIDGSVDEIAAGLVGGLEVIEAPGSSTRTAAALDRLPVESIGPALEILESNSGPEAVAGVIAAIDQVAHDEVPNHEHGNLVNAAITNARSDRGLSQGSNAQINEQHQPARLGRSVEAVRRAFGRTSAEAQKSERKPSWGDRLPVDNIQVLKNHCSHAYEAAVTKTREQAKGGIVLKSQLERAGKQASTERFIEVVRQIPPSMLLEMRKDPNAESLGFNRAIIDAFAAISSKPDLYARFDARLCGHESIRAKLKYQTETGIDDGRTVSPYDALYDLPTTASGAEKKAMTGDLLIQHYGFSSRAASELLVAMSGRVTTQEQGTSQRVVNTERIRSELKRIENIIGTVGTETVKGLRERCGIVNIGELSREQAHRMKKFIDGDPELIEDLRSKEVCVVLRDATSDWNGAFQGINENYETVDGATLIFEVSDRSDASEQIRAYMSLLRVRGIDPSVMVIAGHGRAGAVHIGDSHVTPVESDIPGIDTQKQTDFFATGLIDTIKNMKPDRDGNCTVIYEACSQDGSIYDTDDTALTRTAHVVSTMNVERNKTFMVMGTERPSNIRRNEAGDFVDAYAGQNISRVIVGGSGAVYRQTTTDRAPRLPMFDRKPDAIRLKKANEPREVAAA